MSSLMPRDQSDRAFVVKMRCSDPTIQGGGRVVDFLLAYVNHPNDVIDLWKLFDHAATYSNDFTELAPSWGDWIQTTVTNTWTAKRPVNY
jgi:hypothetical protein